MTADEGNGNVVCDERDLGARPKTLNNNVLGTENADKDEVDIVKEIMAGLKNVFLEEGADLKLLPQLETMWRAKIDAAEEKERQLRASLEPQLLAAKSKSAKMPRQKPQKAKRQNAPCTSSSTDLGGMQLVTRGSKSRAQRSSGSKLPSSSVLHTPALRRSSCDSDESVDIDSLLNVTQEDSSKEDSPAIHLTEEDKILLGKKTVSVKLKKIKIPSVTQKKIKIPKQTLKKMKGAATKIPQVDGPADSSDDEEEKDDEDEDDDDDDDDSDDDLDANADEEDEGAEEEPLGSEDDISDEDATELYDTDNVVVCQYDKISRTRNKWKFNLKDGIMSLNGKDYVFSKAHGEAEW
jgi:transcription initiation factor TFIIA large subunit